MTPVHSPWPLFSDDLDLAQSWMREQLRRFPMTADAGHTALNIGYVMRSNNNVSTRRTIGKQRSSVNSDSAWPAWMGKNPYRELIPVPSTARSAALSRGCPNKTLRVRLFGGLGDQLELRVCAALEQPPLRSAEVDG